MPMYKRDTTGAIRVWDCEFNTKTGEYRTIAGVLNGQHVTSEWTKPTPKNVGRANETCPVIQGMIERNAMIVKKKKEGYFEDINDIDKSTLIKPMLAHKYNDHKDDIKFPVYSQPKLDGFRCIATKEGLFSRKGEKFLSCPHIEEVMIPICKEYNVIFDGELYNHDLRENFNSIQSLITKKKLTESDFTLSKEKVQYHIYDILSLPTNYDDRWLELQSYALNHDDMDCDMIGLVSTAFVENQQDLDNLYQSYMEEGYEGQMVRTISPYQNKRSKFLLKRKEFEDAEFTITAVEEGLGNRSGMAGAIICNIAGTNKTFGCGIKGGIEVNKQLWNVRDTLIGRTATVRFQNYTPDGIPRFPVFYGLREAGI